MEADEILVTSSSNFCLRVDHVDGKPVGGKAPELYEKIRKAVVDEFLEATNKPVSEKAES
jgi:D-alanine transaminase